MPKYNIELGNGRKYDVVADNRVLAIRQAQTAAARFGTYAVTVELAPGETPSSIPFEADELSVRPTADDITTEVQTQTQTLPDENPSAGTPFPMNMLLDSDGRSIADDPATKALGLSGLDTGGMLGNTGGFSEAQLAMMEIQRRTLEVLVNSWTDPFVLKAYIAEASENQARQYLSQYGYNSRQIDQIISTASNISNSDVEEAYESATEEDKLLFEKSSDLGSEDDESGDDEKELEIESVREEEEEGEEEVDGAGDGDNGVERREQDDKIVGIFPAEDYPQANLSEFLNRAGYTLPTDTSGRPMPLDAFSALPGFPAELLDPSNLFIRIIEEQDVFDDDGEFAGTEQIERFVPNPALEAALELYGREIGLRSNLAGEANALVQAQISATGGVLPGPASNLSTDDFNSLAANLRTISSTGGRLTSDLKTVDGRTRLVEELSPLAKQDLTQEVLRQTGGRVGGYFDAQGKFIEGETFEQFIADQRRESEIAQQRDLERIQAQNVPNLFNSQINAQQNEAQRRQGLLSQITGIYQNPTQLAAIVQAGGGPLLQLQQELANQPGMPIAPGMQTPTPMSQQTSTIGTGGTYLDENFVPPTGLTLDEYIATLSPEQRITQPTTPITQTGTTGQPPTPVSTFLPVVQGYNPRLNEAAFNELNPIQQQQAYGSAAVFGKTPEEVRDDLLDYTPGQQSSPLYGVGGTTQTLGR